MSLLQRVERAQQPVESPGENPPVQPPRPAPVPSSSSSWAREEMLRNLRVRMQEEVMRAFDSLLGKNTPAEL